MLTGHAALLPALNLMAPVRGIQLDADIPTEQLPAAYAGFLSRVRRLLTSGWPDHGSPRRLEPFHAAGSRWPSDAALRRAWRLAG